MNRVPLFIDFDDIETGWYLCPSCTILHAARFRTGPVRLPCSASPTVNLHPLAIETPELARLLSRRSEQITTRAVEGTLSIKALVVAREAFAEYRDSLNRLYLDESQTHYEELLTIRRLLEGEIDGRA
ncbi:MAG TPA: hypothetical protein ENN69_00830 [Spirochaetia bacterium]|nr:hypothetical protein [Spirochaetia bacterium]